MAWQTMFSDCQAKQYQGQGWEHLALATSDGQESCSSEDKADRI